MSCLVSQTCFRYTQSELSLNRSETAAQSHKATRLSRSKHSTCPSRGGCARAAPQVAESVSSGVWDDRYIDRYGELKYATALLQGNR